MIVCIAYEKKTEMEEVHEKKRYSEREKKLHTNNIQLKTECGVEKAAKTTTLMPK